MAESEGGIEDSPRGAAPHKRRGLKWVLVTGLKVLIAVVGIWLVLRSISWHDTAIVSAGTEIRTAKLVHDVEVRVEGEENKPALLSVEFIAPVEVDMPVRGSRGAGVVERLTIDPRHNDYNFPAEIRLPLGYFKPLEQPRGAAKGAAVDVVHRGLRSIVVAASARWYLLLAAWAILITPFLVTAIRWRGLLRPQGIHLPLLKCLQLTFVGQFYSIVLPSLTGGDLVKIVYAARLTGSKTKSLITVLLDRMIGLVALMSIGALAAGWQLWLNHTSGGGLGDQTLQNVFILIVALLAGFLLCGIFYFSRRLRRLIGLQWFIDTFNTRGAEPTAVQHAHLVRLHRAATLLAVIASVLAAGAAAWLRWMSRLSWARHNATALTIVAIVMGVFAVLGAFALLIHGKLIDRHMPLLVKVVRWVIHVDEVLHTYRGHFGLLAWSYFISLLSQLTLPIAAWLSGMAFGIHMNLGYYLAYVPVAILAASLPISPPQGLGFLEVVFQHLFAERGLADASQAFALTQAVRFLPMLWNLVGVYWVIRGRFSRHDAAEAGPGDPAPAMPT